MWVGKAVGRAEAAAGMEGTVSCSPLSIPGIEDIQRLELFSPLKV